MYMCTCIHLSLEKFMTIREIIQEDPLEEGMATHSSVLAWGIPMYSGAWRAIVHGVTKSQTQLSD